MSDIIIYDNEDDRPDPPYTRLKRGMIVVSEGARWRVGLVNECRARLDPITRVKREIVTKGGEEMGGKTIEVLVYPASKNISPNAEIPIVALTSPNPKAIKNEPKPKSRKTKRRAPRRKRRRARRK